MKAGFYSALQPTQRAGEGFVGKKGKKKKNSSLSLICCPFSHSLSEIITVKHADDGAGC